MIESELLPLAAKLCKSAGRAAPQGLEPLAGGRNNRVYRIVTAGELLLLKSYSADARDPRDRQGAEWRFLNYVRAHEVKTVPEPLAQDTDARLTLMSLVQGEKLGENKIERGFVDQAAEFILLINRDRAAAEKFQPASEACFSLSDHLQTIERRVERLSKLDADAPFHEEARQFVRQRLRPEWKRLKEKIQTGASAASLSSEQKIISPSDFGFHNALADEAGQLTFIDFEYAGCDDPAKLVCDFFCCPDLPAPLSYWEQFIEKLKAGLNLNAEFRTRCKALLDAYRIKWACIILNDFLPIDEARRQFANTEARAVRCEQQLQKAKLKLDEIGLKG